MVYSNNTLRALGIRVSIIRDTHHSCAVQALRACTRSIVSLRFYMNMYMINVIAGNAYEKDVQRKLRCVARVPFP